MSRYLLNHVATGLAMLLVTSVIIFVALRVIPGDPTLNLTLSGTSSPEQIEAVRERLGLNQSIPEQYVDWVTNAAQGDLGYSYANDIPTTELVKERIVPTLILAIVALGLAVVIAVALAAIGAVYHDRGPDRILGSAASAGVAVPHFWLAIIVLGIFSVRLGWFPSRGYVPFTDDPVEGVRHLTLPALTLCVILVAPIFRFFRASVLEVTDSDFVRTARSKGISEKSVALRHVLPNAAVPTVSYVGIIAGHLLGGVVVIEYVYGWPGLGSLAVDAVSQRDYAVLQGVVLFAAAIYIVVMILTDLLALAIDPRLRPSNAK